MKDKVDHLNPLDIYSGRTKKVDERATYVERTEYRDASGNILYLGT